MKVLQKLPVHRIRNAIYCPCAMGVTLDDATLSIESEIPDIYVTKEGGSTDAVSISGNNGFSIVVTLDPESLESLLSTATTTATVIVGHKGSGGDGDYTTGIYTKGEGSLIAGWKASIPWNNNSFLTNLSNPTGWAWDDVSAAALTYVFYGQSSSGDVQKGTSVFLTLANADNEVIYENSANISALVSSGNNYKELYFNEDVITSAYVFNTALGAADATAITKSLVPEPATVTLSLLALAGLAARRRRH